MAVAMKHIVSCDRVLHSLV